MGNGISGEKVFANVNGLNHLFGAEIFNARPKGTRAIALYIRRNMFPNFLRHIDEHVPRQGSLWFAASVLTPHMQLDSRHPATTHRRWLKWLMWLQKAHPVEHNRIVDAINLALDTPETDTVKPCIGWRWIEVGSDEAFSVQIAGPDRTGRQEIIVTSLKGDLSEVDKLVAEDEDK